MESQFWTPSTKNRLNSNWTFPKQQSNYFLEYVKPFGVYFYNILFIYYIKYPFFSIIAKLLGVKMVGLKDFVVNKLSINLLRFRLDYDFSLEALDMSAGNYLNNLTTLKIFNSLKKNHIIHFISDNYDMDGNIIDFHLFGNGPAR